MSKIKLEDFKSWFADPEAELRNFIDSNQAIMSIVFQSGGRNRVIELSKRDAAQLLDEIVKEKEE